MQTLQTIFWLLLALAFLIGVPVVLVWTMIDYFHGKGSDRRGTGGITAGVAVAMQELDRIMTRPSALHQIEMEHHTLRREDDAGGNRSGENSAESFGITLLKCS